MYDQTVVTAAALTLSGGVLALMIAVVVAVAFHGHQDRREPLRAAGRAALVTVATREDPGDPQATALPPELRGLRRGELFRVLQDVASSVSGTSLAAVRTVATRSGAVQAARRQLRSRRWSRRLRAARLLTAVGAAPGTSGLTLLRDRRAVVRVQAVVWAATAPDLATTEALAGLLADPDGRCRFAARDALLRIGNPAVPLVARLLTAPDQRTVAAALTVAAAVGHPSYLPDAIEITRRGPAEHRALAAEVLGACADPASLPALTTLLADPEHRVRAAAATALADLGDWSATVAVADLLHDDSWPVRRAAGLALLRLGAPGLVLLRQAARGDGTAAGAAARMLRFADRSETGTTALSRLPGPQVPAEAQRPPSRTAVGGPVPAPSPRGTS